MLNDEEPTSADEAAERMQSLLTQAQDLVRAAADLGKIWDLQFQFMDELVTPRGRNANYYRLDETDFHVEEWESSSMLC